MKGSHKETDGFIGAAAALVACLLLVDLSPLILAGCSTTGGNTPTPDPVIPMPVLTGTVERAAKECEGQTPTISMYGPLAAEMLDGEPFR